MKKETHEAFFPSGRILWRGTLSECRKAVKGTNARIKKITK
jgi:hypothetical protein